MREPNLCFPSQNRAVVCISSALYDRRALDCTATLPLVNSLTHLVYLTSTTPRIREILCLDGGLERLIRILQQTSSKADRLTLWKWTLAFQNIVNIGVRGTEQIRTKVVDAGVIPFVLTILGNYEKSYELVNGKKELRRGITAANTTTSSALSKGLLDPISSISYTNHLNNASSSTHSMSTRSNSKDLLRRSVFPYIKIDPNQRRLRRIHRGKQDATQPELENVFHREEDVLLCLQLLAYLSKYPHIRDLFHTSYEKNVFTVIEKFCNRVHPAPIQYWASVIMRNACRKDETQGGIRRCANMSCGKWESQPREFAKCRRCRKAKYCSKPCQSKAWADGHRWWCVERQSSSLHREQVHPSTSAPTTTTIPPSAAMFPTPNNINFTPLNDNSSPSTNYNNEQLSSENDNRMTINTDNGESSDNQNVIFNVTVNI